ncbi:MAG: membrane protein insertase YidC [Bifidobacteriaceae bacterium]|jgi:YidC/Oxa1 family membrane protein insertase|nr:membrane protein insertase YidC [Bifidobacteriaceae bacterium]
MDWFDSILRPIMWAVAWIMYLVHEAASGLKINQDISWVLSIVVLVVIMRLIMIPLFVRQIKSSRGMQLLQPEMQKIQKRYKGKTDPVSRRRMQEETMALYRKHGSNPMSGCWPVLAQSPLFFALFRVLYSLGRLADGTYGRPAVGPITKDVALQIQGTHLFGAPLSATFLNQNSWAGADSVSVRIVTVVLIILMSVTTFTTQRQLTMKNMPDSAKDNQMFRMQKMMMYAMPGVFAVSGVNFPIGVLIYWLTTNLWSMGQQFFVIRNMPAPGSEAERRLAERKARRRERKGLGPEDEDDGGRGQAAGDTEADGGTQRVQPRRTTRAQRRSGPLQAANPSPRADGPRREIEPEDAASEVAETADATRAEPERPATSKKTDDQGGAKAGKTARPSRSGPDLRDFGRSGGGDQKHSQKAGAGSGDGRGGGKRSDAVAPVSGSGQAGGTGGSRPRTAGEKQDSGGTTVDRVEDSGQGKPSVRQQPKRRPRRKRK